MTINIGLEDVRQAARRIRPYIHRTPVLTCAGLDRMVGGRLHFKCENFQKAGAFKARGAANAVLALAEQDVRRGVATHSSGNHAAALAYAAGLRATSAYVVMPEDAPEVKKKAVAGYGGQITFCRPTLAARQQCLEQVLAQTGAVAIHPYNDERVIAGQATAALELFADVPALDAVVAPIGGGGLTAGTALALKALAPSTRVIAAEPEAADDAFRSFHAGRIFPSENPRTVADGLRTSLGDKTFALIRKYVDEIVTVPEEKIIAAMRITWERMKILIEPSAAVPLAAILAGRLDIKDQTVGIIVSGGNVDLQSLPWAA